MYLFEWLIALVMFGIVVVFVVAVSLCMHREAQERGLSGPVSLPPVPPSPELGQLPQFFGAGGLMENEQSRKGV